MQFEDAYRWLIRNTIQLYVKFNLIHGSKISFQPIIQFVHRIMIPSPANSPIIARHKNTPNIFIPRFIYLITFGI